MTEKLPYNADHVIYRDFGHTVNALWTADPVLAEQLRNGDDDTFNRAILNPRNEIEVVGRISRCYKSEGALYSGWVISSGDGREHPVSTRKPDAMAVLRQTVADYFDGS
ncbi:hypothetical protein [Microbispora sp. NPDC049125]|uniref:hypothetical protein n=1 Tax=Microbispora sp. NPDC049125 TaxID=3154929 RepID=UPI003467CB0D